MTTTSNFISTVTGLARWIVSLLWSSLVLMDSSIVVRDGGRAYSLRD